ncbi:hypothetical protein Hanom_Chr01g00040261 [Helianthus anomalus]
MFYQVPADEGGAEEGVVMGCVTLRECGEEVGARGLIRENSPWDRMFLVASTPSYRTMMAEFLSTFVFRPQSAHRPNSDMDDPNVNHRLLRYLSARVSLIPDTLIRYIHRCMAMSISSCGKSNMWVTKVDLFFLYCLFTGTPFGLHRCLAEYFTSYNKRQRCIHLYGGAFITRTAQHCGQYFLFIEDLSPPSPFEYLGIRTMIRIKIAVNLLDIGHQFVGLDQHIFIPEPFVHQALPEARKVEMSHVAGAPIIDGHVEPEVDQGHPQEPPQIPRRVYHAVRLP